MPPTKIKSPQSLEKLCFLEVVMHLRRELHVCNQVAKFEKKSLLLRRRGLRADQLQLEVGYYLDKLPPLLSEIVRQDIINLLMSKTKEFLLLKSIDADLDPSSPEVHFGMYQGFSRQQHTLIQLLEIVLNHEIKSFEFYESGQHSSLLSSSKIWNLILRCTGLERLIFTTDMFIGEPVEERNFLNPFIASLTVNCPSLTELVLKDAVTNSELLQLIGKNCHHLKKLDLTGSRINCSDILRLCIESQPSKLDVPAETSNSLTPLCQTLEELILNGTNVRAKGAGRLLQLISNLTSLGDLVYTAAGLQSIYSLIKAKKSRTLKLKHVFYRGPSNIKLKILANCCPSLESLYLGSKTERRIHAQLHLNSLSFKCLHSLTLENIHSDDIPLALQHAPNLTNLNIDCSGLDVSGVSKHCPMLRVLTIHKEPVRVLQHKNVHAPMFGRLEELRVLSPISATVAGAFFVGATRLRSMELVRVRDVGDEDVGKWLNANPLVHLETLMIRYIACTLVTVHRLLCQCPRLTKLGEMGGWDIRSWECRRIKDLIASKNYDLELVVHTAASGDIYDIFQDNMSSDGDGSSSGNSHDEPNEALEDLIYWR